MHVRFTNVKMANGAIEADLEITSGPIPVTPPDVPPAPPVQPPVPDQPPTPLTALPTGYDSDPNVGYRMFVEAMDRHGLTPVGVQGHGQTIVDALNETWPGLNVYLSPSDAPVWPGFGSIDVTIDSGKGGWQFRKDGVMPYAR